jgi:hypothetical protein
MTQDSTFEIKYVTGTKVYLDESGETVITIGYVEIPDLAPLQPLVLLPRPIADN